MIHLEEIGTKIFEGNYLKSGYSKPIIPYADSFNLLNLALRVGFTPNRIGTSDITLIGYFFCYLGEVIDAPQLLIIINSPTYKVCVEKFYDTDGNMTLAYSDFDMSADLDRFKDKIPGHTIFEGADAMINFACLLTI